MSISLEDQIIVFTNFSLSLPDKIKVTDIKWLSVWSRHFQFNFGNILFPENLSFENNTMGSLVLSGLTDGYEHEDDKGPIPSSIYSWY